MVEPSAAPAPASGPRPAGFWRRALSAGGLYFLVVFAIAFSLGAVRSLMLEPFLPKLAATAIEAPFLLFAFIWAAHWIALRFGLRGNPPGLLLMGLVGLALQQAADAALGLTLRGLTLEEQYAQFSRPEGWLFAVLLVVYLLAPFATGRRYRR